MLFNVVKVGCQEFEPGKGAVGHVNVHVHPARPEQCRVELLLVVGGEDVDPLIPTTRP